jgi:hypothetical protein
MFPEINNPAIAKDSRVAQKPVFLASYLLSIRFFTSAEPSVFNSEGPHK